MLTQENDVLLVAEAEYPIDQLAVFGGAPAFSGKAPRRPAQHRRPRSPAWPGSTTCSTAAG